MSSDIFYDSMLTSEANLPRVLEQNTLGFLHLHIVSNTPFQKTHTSASSGLISPCDNE